MADPVVEGPFRYFDAFSAGPEFPDYTGAFAVSQYSGRNYAAWALDSCSGPPWNYTGYDEGGFTYFYRRVIGGMGGVIDNPYGSVYGWYTVPTAYTGGFSITARIVWTGQILPSLGFKGYALFNQTTGKFMKYKDITWVIIEGSTIDLTVHFSANDPEAPGASPWESYPPAIGDVITYLTLNYQGGVAGGSVLDNDCILESCPIGDQACFDANRDKWYAKEKEARTALTATPKALYLSGEVATWSVPMSHHSNKEGNYPYDTRISAHYTVNFTEHLLNTPVAFQHGAKILESQESVRGKIRTRQRLMLDGIRMQLVPQICPVQPKSVFWIYADAPPISGWSNGTRIWTGKYQGFTYTWPNFGGVYKCEGIENTPIGHNPFSTPFFAEGPQPTTRALEVFEFPRYSSQSEWYNASYWGDGASAITLKDQQTLEYKITRFWVEMDSTTATATYKVRGNWWSLDENGDDDEELFTEEIELYVVDISMFVYFSGWNFFDNYVESYFYSRWTPYRDETIVFGKHSVPGYPNITHDYEVWEYRAYSYGTINQVDMTVEDSDLWL